MYLKALGSTCYDRSGITWPEKVAIDWLALFEVDEIVWEQNRSNQPEVISVDQEMKRAFNRNAKKYPGLWVYNRVEGIPRLLIVDTSPVPHDYEKKYWKNKR